MSDRKALAREIAARTKPRFIEIPRERGGVRVPFTEEQLTAMRGGLTAEEYRWKLIREWGESSNPQAQREAVVWLSFSMKNALQCDREADVLQCRRKP